MFEGNVPHNPDAEKAVLGSILIDSEMIHQVDIPVAAFFIPENQYIFDAVVALKGSGISQITVAHELAKRGKLDDIGGIAYLSHLVANTPTSLHAPYYAQIVRECYENRCLINAASQLQDAAGAGGDPRANVSAAIKNLLSIHGNSGHSGLTPMSDVVNANIEATSNWIGATKYEIEGLSTGFKDLDVRINGLEKGKLYIMAARPSMGKTMLALNMAKAIAKSGRHVAFFSLEQNKRAVLERMVFSEAKLNRYKVRRSDEFSDREKFWEAWAEVEKLPIMICDTSFLTTDQALSEVMIKQSIGDIDVVFFDYIGEAGDKETSEVRRIGNIVKNLRALGRLCNVPVVAVSQLSRAPEHRPVDKGAGVQGRRPGLSDLRDSGELEQVADVVIGLYRDEYYNTATMTPKVLECIVLKNRDGPRGTVELYYNSETGFMADKAQRL